ncbi:HU family DNA-binding protein [Bacteroides sp. GD17]|jgi:predicted histone-like DNA-binding protein|uniref:HU family DNA-binding protein n=1 Tax=Bacteroides sp. GD17 TaxID=3139826 RepID=UPI0025EFCAAA|nr:HU family DNA-binding protein [uncultured Bacteroides sp.]
MALNYEVKKRVFGFDETKTEKYVAQMKTLGMLEFKDLCDEVTKVGMAPRGVVKLVLDGLIDTLNMNINKGFSVQLGDFGCFRPGINAKSQETAEKVTAGTVYRRKIIFTPGTYFKDMLTRASVEKVNWSGNGTVSGGSSNPNPDGGDSGSDGDQGENPLG